MPEMKQETPRPRIGVPYRTRKEEVNGERERYEGYLRAIESAGGEPVEISLGLSAAELSGKARELDGVVLPGSPADVNPARFHAARHAKTADADAAREKTDLLLLGHCFAEGKPVLAICYGIQILNVHLGGTLVQDIASEVETKIQHEWIGRERGTAEPIHRVAMETDSKIRKLNGKGDAEVNSSHHQAIREPGKSLRVTARATDGVIEAVEWTGDANWVVGVQWHPERMAREALTAALFGEMLRAARRGMVRA